ncbi:glycerate 2-kinase [Cyclonatronum proteinivorum]|uniref:Glycerate 2-kinase n=1 Tax=Cyclonatronum proteinivorum TaxID=1457365 RepID=A0A345UK83_9BACT|nr:DUF4147 domain-containing protein [Cyclonatronum proteinivorum]AXJ00885.1 glycerate 2-kinase [Cyclonatronum proteinivorum]
MDALRETALRILRKTLAGMAPDKLVVKSVTKDEEQGTIKFGDSQAFSLDTPVYVLGAGKAAAAMAQGLHDVLGSQIRDGLVIAPTAVAAETSRIGAIQVFPGSHPQPDEDTIASTLELLSVARSIPKDALTVVLISGGASALLELPAGKLTLEQLRDVYHELLRSGAPIQEMNTVRKQLSAVKGGQLLQHISSDKVVSLLISDVPGDDPAFIASGPTTPDSTSAQDALAVLKKYGLDVKIPPEVLAYLHEVSQDAKPAFEGYHHVEIVGSSGIFAKEAEQHCQAEEFETWIDPQQYDAPIEEVADYIIEQVRTNRKRTREAFLFHGESTVQVSGDGKGGRNQHLALLLATKITRRKRTLVMSVGTDGGDGNTDVAGAFAAPDSVARAEAIGVSEQKHLAEFDAYHFFKSLGDLIFTGPTGNNVMDFQLILIDS